MRKYPRFIVIGLVLALLILVITACGNEQDSAGQAIEAYIRALSDKDSIQIRNLSCTSWEQDALLEIDSLTAVGSKVENLSCSTTSQEIDLAYVSCTGIIALDYNGEAQQIDLSSRTYITKQEDGEWRMCGYR